MRTRDIFDSPITLFVIAVAGTKAAGYADRLADRSGLGEAITGTVFLGLLTALPGLAASVIAAMKGHPAMAIANAMGGIAAQTAALAVADIAYHPANLEHAAASVVNMMQTITLILLMVLVVAGISGPDVTIGHVHLMTPLLIAAAGFAFWIAIRTRRQPMWRPKSTRETGAAMIQLSHIHIMIRRLRPTESPVFKYRMVS